MVLAYMFISWLVFLGMAYLLLLDVSLWFVVFFNVLSLFIFLVMVFTYGHVFGGKVSNIVSDLLFIYSIMEWFSFVLFLLGYFLDLTSFYTMFCMSKGGVLPFFLDSFLIKGEGFKLEGKMVFNSLCMMGLFWNKVLLGVGYFKLFMGFGAFMFVIVFNLMVILFILLYSWKKKGISLEEGVFFTIWMNNMGFLCILISYSCQMCLIYLLVSFWLVYLMVCSSCWFESLFFLIMVNSPFTFIYWVKLFSIISLSNEEFVVFILFSMCESFLMVGFFLMYVKLVSFGNSYCLLYSFIKFFLFYFLVFYLLLLPVLIS